ncbi:hypothetical protein GWP57_13555 [Gammaproteobacteria bacterium]|jgi:hypothetical protein|nr:hypothetical protein [Gammaproteobacteria bacterium]
MTSCLRQCARVLIPAWLTGLSVAGFAQESLPVSQPANDSAPPAAEERNDSLVNYPAEFFTRYQPKTALDIVNRVPGFTLDDGGDKRGFGGAAGNVLINDRRPSTKQDSPSAILNRISAEQVERVELIRVRVRDIDLQGYPEVINVRLRADAPATIRWEVYFRYNFDQGLTPFAGISFSDRWKDIEYNVGFDARYSRFGDPGAIETFDPDGVLTEVRVDEDHAEGPDFNGYLNAATWLGRNFVRLNSRINSENRDILLQSTTTPQVPGELPSQEIIATVRDNKRLEIGLDGERILSSDLLGKAIILYSLLEQEPSSSQQDLDSDGQQTRFRLEDESATKSELITRFELNWAGLDDHAIQVNLERAFNVLDNEQVFTDDTGDGPVVIEIPGGNVRVEEERWNFVAQDTWTLGDFSLDYGLGYERSTITQTGDANQERTFSFIKPRAILTYSPRQGQQTRLRAEREVSQLDFDDFVSAAVFEDDDIALGNPDLRPDNTWILELSHERRFGDVAVVKGTVFHNWVEDTLDFLPLTPTFEVNGNIGDARRWGVILETTLPVFPARLENARLDFKARWQDSTVVDPVTGDDRVLSGEGGFRDDMAFLNENRYAFDVKFRQDLESQKVSWGLGLGWRADRPLFKADELDVFDEDYQATAFIQTTRWLGMRISLEGENMLDSVFYRDRTIFEGERSLTPVKRREIREGTNGVRIWLRMSGTF